MNYQIVNLSKKVSERDVKLMVAAVKFQFKNHYCPAWSCLLPSFKYVGAGVDSIAKVQQHAILCTVEDKPDVPDAGGYHTIGDDGRISMKIFVDPYLNHGGSVLGSGNNTPSVSEAMSHEFIETNADLFCNYWADGVGLDKGNQVAFELCDPVENDGYYVHVMDPNDSAAPLVPVMVSNFVLRSWFNKEDSNGPWDFMHRVRGFFKMSPGGYLIVRTSPGDEQTVFGSEFPEWKKELKKADTARAFRRMQGK